MRRGAEAAKAKVEAKIDSGRHKMDGPVPGHRHLSTGVADIAGLSIEPSELSRLRGQDFSRAQSPPTFLVEEAGCCCCWFRSTGANVRRCRAASGCGRAITINLRPGPLLWPKPGQNMEIRTS
jgi:hypothetical protein